MSVNRRLARRYAHALGILAEERKSLGRIESDLELVRNVLQENPELWQVLLDERILSDQKRKLLERLFAEQVATATLHFLYLVVSKHRIRHLDAMIDEYIRYANQRRGIIEVDVTSAMDMDEALVASLTDGLSEAFGTKVRLRTSKDAELLGGVTLRVGDLLIDGSAASRLARLKRSLKAAQLN